jgi:DNA (cytosine-5)-methyltransferase 3A
MKVLSLFDGISVARHSLGDRVTEYYSSEIDPHAIKVSKKNYPDIKRLGDVRTVEFIPDLDLLIGGSPCQDLSIAKKDRKGLDGDRSGLFYEYIRILKLCNPKYFILENVNSMPKEARAKITEEMGVEPIMIDAALVSAQSRKRLFWTNIPVQGLPEDRKIALKDILEPEAEVDERMVRDGKAYCLTATYSHANATEAGIRNSVEKKQRMLVKHTTKKLGYVGEHDHQANRVYDETGKSPAINTLSANGLVKIGHIGNSNGQANRVYSPEGKSVTLSSNGGGLGAKTGLYQTPKIRKLTPIECERLQSLPDNYTAGISNTQRYKCLGNAFNSEVIKFIVSFIP